MSFLHLRALVWMDLILMEKPLQNLNRLAVLGPEASCPSLTRHVFGGDRQTPPAPITVHHRGGKETVDSLGSSF